MAVYRKLNVTSRNGAVERARELIGWRRSRIWIVELSAAAGTTYARWLASAASFSCSTCSSVSCCRLT